METNLRHCYRGEIRTRDVSMKKTVGRRRKRSSHLRILCGRLPKKQNTDASASFFAISFSACCLFWWGPLTGSPTSLRRPTTVQLSIEARERPHLHGCAEVPREAEELASESSRFATMLTMYLAGCHGTSVNPQGSRDTAFELPTACIPSHTCVGHLPCRTLTLARRHQILPPHAHLFSTTRHRTTNSQSPLV